MPQSQHDLIDGNLLEAFHLFSLAIFFNHRIPIEIHDTGEHIRVELGVFDVAEVLSQVLGREGLGLPPAAFIPPDSPAFDALSSVDPWLSHSANCIGTLHGLGHLRVKESYRVVSKRRHGRR